MFKIHDSWFWLMPRLVETIPSPKIQPLTRPIWKYVNPVSLATSRIYSTGDLDLLRNHIIFLVEKLSMGNTIAKGAMGQCTRRNISMMNFLNEQLFDKIAKSARTCLWKGFVIIRISRISRITVRISAEVLVVFIIIQFIKLMMDTIIHGYALHSTMQSQAFIF